MRESDLYDPIKNWMEQRGFTVYPEVECRHSGGRADIVVINGATVGVVEMKQSLTLDLIDQALRWRGYANYIWIAIPYKKNTHKKFVNMVLQDYGIGVLTVSKYGTVWTDKLPKFARKTLPHLKEALTEHHLTSGVKGGHHGGGYVTPYRITINNVRRFLQKKGTWCDMKTILDYCETHYAQPRSSLGKALQTYEAEWCETKKEKGVLYFRSRQTQKKEADLSVKLTEKQASLLLVLTESWQPPTQLARKLPNVNPARIESSGSLYVNPILKALISKGLAEKKTEGRAQYRLTEQGEVVRNKIDPD